MTTLKQIKQGFLDITPIQKQKARLNGQFMAVVGILLAIVVMCTRGLGYWILFMLGIGVLQVVGFIDSYQAYHQLKKLEDMEKKLNEGGKLGGE